jgi:hypothetical protein
MQAGWGLPGLGRLCPIAAGGVSGRRLRPVPELISALNFLTGGALSQIDPGQAEMLVRGSYNLARSSGIGLDQLTMLSELASQQAIGMGLNPAFGMQAVQGNLTFGSPDPTYPAPWHQCVDFRVRNSHHTDSPGRSAPLSEGPNVCSAPCRE